MSNQPHFHYFKENYYVALENRLGLTPCETKQLHALFIRHAGRERRLYYEDLTSLMLELNPHLNKTEIKSHVIKSFRTIDTNNDGTISLYEFMVAYSNSKKVYNIDKNYNGLFIP